MAIRLFQQSPIAGIAPTLVAQYADGANPGASNVPLVAGTTGPFSLVYDGVNGAPGRTEYFAAGTTFAQGQQPQAAVANTPATAQKKGVMEVEVEADGKLKTRQTTTEAMWAKAAAVALALVVAVMGTAFYMTPAAHPAPSPPVAPPAPVATPSAAPAPAPPVVVTVSPVLPSCKDEVDECIARDTPRIGQILATSKCSDIKNIVPGIDCK